MKKSKRLRLLIFSTYDIGSNIRLLSHAKYFSDLDNSRVLILAPDITSLPKQIEQRKNIKQQYFHQFIQLPSFLSFIFYPLQVLFYSIELFITAITYPSFDYCLVSNEESFFLSFLLSKWCHAKLILDYSSLKWSQNDYNLGFLRKIEEKILSLADIHICSTKAIQLILKLRNIDSFVIHDPTQSFIYDQNHPDIQSSSKPIPNKKEQEGQINVNIHNNIDNQETNAQNNEIDQKIPQKIEKDSIFTNFFQRKKESFRILGISQIETEKILCGVPFLFYEDTILTNLLTIADKLIQGGSFFYFIFFPSEKDEKTIKNSIKNHRFKSKSASSRFKIVPMHSDCYRFILSSCDFAILFHTTIFGLEYSPQLSDVIQFGLPVLAFKHGPVCEAVKEGENGFIFDDEIELAKLLNRILNEKSVNLEKLRGFYSSSKFVTKWEIEWKKCFDLIINVH